MVLIACSEVFQCVVRLSEINIHCAAHRLRLAVLGNEGQCGIREPSGLLEISGLISARWKCRCAVELRELDHRIHIVRIDGQRLIKQILGLVEVTGRVAIPELVDEESGFHQGIQGLGIHLSRR